VELHPGTVFAGYTIERLLGAGGMGEVYLARHPRLPRSDALKVLAAQFTTDPDFRARFEREADLAGALSHPAIVKVNDRGEFDGRLWMALELVEGTDLAQRLRAHGPLPVSEVASIAETVADALDFAGSRGLVHRDVKPANILLGDSGHVLLTDFGIARQAAEASELTGTGVTVGTVDFASPEQLSGYPLDPRSDQYSLACTVYALLTGHAPFADSNAGAVIIRHATAAVPSASAQRADLSPAVDRVLARALSKAPANRFPSSREFAAALGSALTSPSGGPTVTIPREPPTAYASPYGQAGYGRTGYGQTMVATAPPRSDNRTWMWIAVATVAVLILGLGGVALAKRGGGSHPTAADPTVTVAATAASAAPTTTAEITFAAMQDLVTRLDSYYPARWRDADVLYDTHYSAQIDRAAAESWWPTIASVTLISVRPRDATSVIERVRYVTTSGTVDTEDRWVSVVSKNGALLVYDSARIGPV
jgi:hypothetical protein